MLLTLAVGRHKKEAQVTLPMGGSSSHHSSWHRGTCDATQTAAWSAAQLQSGKGEAVAANKEPVDRVAVELFLSL